MPPSTRSGKPRVSFEAKPEGVVATEKRRLRDRQRPVACVQTVVAQRTLLRRDTFTTRLQLQGVAASYARLSAGDWAEAARELTNPVTEAAHETLGRVDRCLLCLIKKLARPPAGDLYPPYASAEEAGAALAAITELLGVAHPE